MVGVWAEQRPRLRTDSAMRPLDPSLDVRVAPEDRRSAPAVHRAAPDRSADDRERGGGEQEQSPYLRNLHRAWFGKCHW
jgi:hypothetical protein